MDSTKSYETLTDDAKIKSDLFKLAEKLWIELHKKDEKLQRKNQELQRKNKELKVKDKKLAKEKRKKKKLSTKLQKAHWNRRVNQFDDELRNELARAQRINGELQMILWKSFPSISGCYNIIVKVPSPSGLQYYLFVDKSGQLRLDNRPGFTIPSKFKFAKNANATFSIYAATKGKYLQTQNSSNYSKINFSANDEDSAGQFVLFFHQHQQNQKSGLSVDISTLAGSFLHMNNENCIVANSSKAPYDKFLIVPVDE